MCLRGLGGIRVAAAPCARVSRGSRRVPVSAPPSPKSVTGFGVRPAGVDRLARARPAGGDGARRLDAGPSGASVSPGLPHAQGCHLSRRRPGMQIAPRLREAGSRVSAAPPFLTGDRFRPGAGSIYCLSHVVCRGVVLHPLAPWSITMPGAKAAPRSERERGPACDGRRSRHVPAPVRGQRLCGASE